MNDLGGIAVAPSLLSADFSRLGEEIESVTRAGAGFLHIDVMDGHFVENISMGPIIIRAIASHAKLPLITHLMISDPLRYAEAFVECGSAVVSFHWEACADGHLGIVEKLHDLGCLAGLAINPDTPIEAIRHLLPSVDLLLCMTVFPGFGGQAFISDVLAKVREATRLRDEHGYGYVIEVDGGIKPANAAMVREAGGQILVAGTAVFKSPDYAEAIEAIRG
ncbi:MAG: ribulose-phosphate 3-epimerase [bacterium]|nr:MAG: ribulose-phosphate 3-epimerase [bacterium]